MDSKYSNQSHQELAVVSLASELKISIDEVAVLYGNELTKLKVGSRVSNFLPILALRKVRDTLYQRRLHV